MAFKSRDLTGLRLEMRREVARQMRADISTHERVASERVRHLVLVLNLPPKELSPNARVCWQAKARAIKQYRQHAAVEALSRYRDPPRWKRATAALCFYFPDRRRRDPDNLLASMKPAFDGLTDAGVWADDCGVTYLPVEQLVDRETARVVIMITPIEAGKASRP